MDGFDIIDRLFKTYVLSNARLEKLAEGFRWLEGPAWFGDRNELLFNDLPHNRTMRWSERNGIEVFREPSWFANGQTRDRQGRLISCSHGRRCLLRTDHDGHLTVIADHFEGRPLNSPNDVVVKSDGTVWFTDPHYGIQTDYEGGKAEPELPCRVYRLDPTRGSLTVVTDEFQGPNGLCFSPDESRLYIAETGRLLDPNPVDELLGKVLVPSRVSNVTFGDRGKSRLFICASQTLYAIFLNRRGAERP